jgi:hypothetical protein
LRRREDLLFLKKKKQKDVRPWGPWRQQRHSPQDRKFFGYFFSKKKRLLPNCTSTNHAVEAVGAGSEAYERPDGWAKPDKCHKTATEPLSPL